MMKKCLSILLALTMFCTMPLLSGASEETPNDGVLADYINKPTGFFSVTAEDDDFLDDVSILSDEKKYDIITIEDDFDDDTVLVVLTKSRSWEQYEFTPKDFPELELTEVINLDPGGREQIETQQALLKSMGLTARQLTELSRDTIPWEVIKDYLPDGLLNLYKPSSDRSSEISQDETAWDVLRDVLPAELMDVDRGGLWLVNPEKYRASLSLKLKNPGKENVLEAIRALEKRDDIISASPNGYFTMSLTPNDSLLGQQWAVGTGTGNINMRQAWDITTGGTTTATKATVAVIDSGIQANHPDITPRVSTTLGHDYVAGGGTGHRDDPLGHGTHVAGIIAAAGNNSAGIAGANWNVNLVSLRILDDSGGGSWERAAAAINYARTNNIPIINGSFSGYGDDTAMRNAVNQYGGLMIFAAGNENNNNNSTPCYPASYDRPNLISVGATAANSNSRASYSNYGSTRVHVFAPGTSILSTFPTARCNYSWLIVIDTDGITRRRCEVEPVYLFGVFMGYQYSTVHHSNGYHYCNGTSMAAPYVTGVAALMFSASKLSNQTLTAVQLRNRIIGGVDIYSALNGLCSTGGRLNANNAVIRARYIMGDVNGDGVITSSDSRDVLRYSAGLESFTAKQIQLADVDFNGQVTSADSQIILRISAKLEPPV
ncbi:MAG: S8 family serine peptidase [Oscillospiraceae bacterium]|jgi:subtilisin family serine protease|nr:S8 family serine peptidase [Oscillospiraceae bacterium]